MRMGTKANSGQKGNGNSARSPRLDTILMIERHIRRSDGEHKKRALWESLPKKMMYQTFCRAFDYLLASRKISVDAEGKIGWMYYPRKTLWWLKHGVPWRKEDEQLFSEILRKRMGKAVKR